MKEFKIKERGYFVDGVEQEIGSLHKFESLPASLVNKVIEVDSVEPESPRRGRPPKDSTQK